MKEVAMTEFQIRVPASTSNLGPGFDSLGLALSRYLTVEVGTSNVSRTSFTFEGEGANVVATKTATSKMPKKLKK